MDPGDFETVELRGVGRLFGPVRALGAIDLRIGAGEACVVTGPNGAGKSTLLRILSTLLRPTAGEILFDGRNADESGRSLRGRIAYLSHRTHLHADLTGRECLRLAADLRGLGPNDGWDADTADHDLLGFLDRPVHTCSRGQAQRLAIACSLVGRPRLVLLDEPTSGLDRDAAEHLLTVLRSRVERGAALVVATHDPAAFGSIATRRIEMRDGRVLSDASEGGARA